jgi:hypothetical protein
MNLKFKLFRIKIIFNLNVVFTLNYLKMAHSRVPFTPGFLSGNRGDNLRRPNAIPKGVGERTEGGNGLTNQNPPLALPTPSHIPLTLHSGTEVVTSGFPRENFAPACC